MSRRNAFTQADVRRFFKGAAEAGVTIAVEIGIDGTMRGIPCEPMAKVAAPADFDVMRRIQDMPL